MNNMWLRYFTQDDSFPFYIAYGGHEGDMFMHGHEDFCELVIVTEGSAEHVVEQESFPVRKGDVFVMGKDINHGYDCCKGLRICNIVLPNIRIPRIKFSRSFRQSGRKSQPLE